MEHTGYYKVYIAYMRVWQFYVLKNFYQKILAQTSCFLVIWRKIQSS